MVVEGHGLVDAVECVHDEVFTGVNVDGRRAVGGRDVSVGRVSEAGM